MSETCEQCGEPFASPTSLMEHIHSAHPHEVGASSIDWNPEEHTPGLVCALCGRRFFSARALAQHNLRPHPEPERRRWSGPVPD
jgi:Zinc finger, C2H2 type